MKKLLVLIAALSVFAVACKSNATIDTGSTEQAEATQSETPTATPEAQPERDGDDAAEPTDTAEPDDAPAPTAVPGDEESADEDPTAVPGDEESADEDPTAVPGDEESADEDPTAVPGDEESAPVDTDDAASDPADPAEPAPASVAALQAVADADDWCEAAAAVEDGTAALDDLNFTDPEALEQGMRLSLAAISASRRLVPSKIADDVDQSIEAFSALVTALEAVDWVFIDLDLSIIEQFDGPMELATYNIEAYNFNECGIGTDPGLPPVIADDGTVEGSVDDLPEFDGTIRDQAVAGLVEAGFSQAEADCIFENLDFTNTEVLSDLTAMLEVFADCGISLDRLAQLGGG